jgi:hypothetical protein
MKTYAFFRYASKAVVAALMLTFAGCDDPTEPELISTCATLSGEYVATSISVESAGHSDVFDSFDDAVWVIDFTGPMFESTFARPGAAAMVHGAASTSAGDGRQIILGSEPLLPDLESGNQLFTCYLEANGFDLQTTELDYAFDGDGTYEGAEINASFVAR